MSWNKITNKGAVNIAEAIQINTTLQKFDISHNNTSRDIATVLDFGGHLVLNNTLQELIISLKDTKKTFAGINTFVFTVTNECYVNSIWPYPICYDHTEYFVHKYNH